MFINVGDNRVLKTDEIEMIEKIDDNTCSVYTHHHNYFVNMSFETLYSIIAKDINAKNKVATDLQGVLKHVGHFVG